MRREFRFISLLLLGFAVFWTAAPARAQKGSGTIEGTVKDPAGAVVPGATVEISNPVSQYARTTSTAADGTFRFANVPFNPYHMVAKATGFVAQVQDVEVRSGVPVEVTITLKLGVATAKVTVEATGGDLV